MLRKSFKSSLGTVSYLERTGTLPVIFLHGLGGTGNSWMKLSHFVHEELGLYFLDLLGHGKSEKPSIEYTIDAQETVIDEFVSSQGFDEISLMGNSYGGWIAMRYSLDKHLPTHLVLEDSAGINMTFGELGEEYRNNFVKAIVENNSLNTETVIGNIVKNNSNPAWKMKEIELKKLSAKTLIIWGEEDKVISIDYGRKLREMIPGSKIVELEGAGHVPHFEFPERVAKILNTFLKT